MVKTKKIKGFTLVELLVVITILSILSTLAFLSLQGYSSGARDAKRRTTIGDIRTSIELSLIEGVSIMSFANGTGSVITGGATSGKIQISGRVGYDTLSGSYIAGDLNNTILGLKEENIQDPLTGDLYKFGGTKFENQYNIAGSLEDGGTPDTYVIGNWNPRLSSTARGPRDYIDGKVFYISGMLARDTGLRKGDIVRFGTNTGTYTITKMDYNKIFVDKTIPTTDSDNIMLNKDETTYLIRKRDSPYAIKVGAGEKYLPYKLSQ